MREKIKQVSRFQWEIPIGFREGMHVPGRVFTNKSMIEDILQDQSLKQVADGATLPGVVKASLAMPDIHQGYGLPIGGVVASRVDGGIISPGAAGYDINCGVRLLKTPLNREGLDNNMLRQLIERFFSSIPCGVGSKGTIKVSGREYREVLSKGISWAVKQGLATKVDQAHTEANGALEGANPDLISDYAKERGSRQLGTLGSGNHFLEVQVVDEIYYPEAAQIMGLSLGRIMVMIHSGSRGLGHQVCTDYLNKMRSAKRPSPALSGLIYAPFDSAVGQDYLAAMRAAANYAWTNRQVMTHRVREVFETFLGIPFSEITLIYDLAHNIVKVEKHEVEGRKVSLAVHRKGATRSFPPGNAEVPDVYRQIGQPVLLPGDMGRSSYVMVGTAIAMEESFGSASHGAGRVLSRKAARKKAKGRSIRDELEKKGIYARATSPAVLSEEMPEAYKDIESVVEVTHQVGLARKVARLKPLGVIKG